MTRYLLGIYRHKVLDLEVQERKIYFESRVSLLSCLLNSFSSILSFKARKVILSFKANVSYLYAVYP